MTIMGFDQIMYEKFNINLSYSDGNIGLIETALLNLSVFLLIMLKCLFHDTLVSFATAYF